MVNPPIAPNSLQLPLLFLKAGPAGGRLRRPSSAGNAHGRCLNGHSPTAQKARSGLCEHFSPQASNAHCPFRTNGASYPGPVLAKEPLQNEGGFLPRQRHRGSAACRHCLLTACPQRGGSHAGTTTVWTASRPAGLRLHPGPRRRHASGGQRQTECASSLSSSSCVAPAHADQRCSTVTKRPS
jgi:hypothetical protein